VPPSIILLRKLGGEVSGKVSAARKLFGELEAKQVSPREERRRQYDPCRRIEALVTLNHQLCRANEGRPSFMPPIAIEAPMGLWRRILDATPSAPLFNAMLNV